MHEVNFIFVGGSVINTALSIEAIKEVKNDLSAGKAVTITAQNMDSVIFPNNLLMIQVDKHRIS